MNLKIYLVLATSVLQLCANSSANSMSNDVCYLDPGENLKCSRLPQTQGQAYQLQHLQRKWLTELFLEANSRFVIQGDVNADCRRDFAIYQQFLRNQTVWAVRMSEASQWPTFGLFSGITDFMGNWDECLKATPINFNSQYCMAFAKFNFTYNPSIDENTFEWDSWPNEQRSVWDVIQLWSQDVNRISRQVISWALCIPASCRPPDLEISLKKTLYPIFKKHDLTFSVHVKPEYCKINEEVPYPTSFYAMCVFILLAITHAVLLTVYDCTIPDDLPMKGLKKFTVLYARVFSFRHNLKNLRKISRDTFPIVYLIKIIASLIVIGGHRLIIFYTFPTFNTEHHEILRTNFSFELLENNIVDIFITISGFLMFHCSYNSVQKKGLNYILSYIMKRWLRMMCVPIFVIIFMLTIFPYLDTGPVWNQRSSVEIEPCKRNWWATVFALNNIIEPDKPCLLHSWYLSADLQLTIIGAFILFVMSKNMKLGVIICFLLIAASTVVSFIIIFTRSYWGTLRFTMSNRGDCRDSNEYHFYVGLYNRIGSYIVGILAALLTRTLKEKQYEFPPFTASLILASTFIVGFTFASYAYLFYKPHRPYSAVENAVYAALNRTLFSLPFACLLCIHFTSGLGVFSSILDNKIFVPYGRLTYCAYLLGIPLQMILSFSLKTYLPIQDRIYGYWLITSDMIWIFFFAFIMYLTVEAPASNIINFIL